MRVTLVHPAGFNFVPGQPDFSVLANRMPPIGIMQLASWLEKFGHQVQLHDCLGPYAPATTAENAEIVLATNPQMVGFSATTSGFMDAFEIAAIIRERRPDIRIVFGNVHVSSLGAPILEKFPEIDCLVIGEGEGAMLELADGKPLAEIGNLIWRNESGRIIVNPRRDRIVDLDELPFPAYEKLAGFPHDYHLPLFAYEKKHGATMITSRGCPYTCSFCDRTVFERLYKTNSPQYIYDHMKYLRDKFGVWHINMYDDLFTAKKQRVMDLCQLLIDKPLGMQFNCAIRAGHTSDEMLLKLKQVLAKWLYRYASTCSDEFRVGVEKLRAWSGNSEDLNTYDEKQQKPLTRKAMPLADFRRALLNAIEEIREKAPDEFSELRLDRDAGESGEGQLVVSLAKRPKVLIKKQPASSPPRRGQNRGGVVL